MYKEFKVTRDFNTEVVRQLVQAAVKAESQVYLLHDNKKVNAKSLMGMLALALKRGDTVFVHAVGEDEEEIIDLFETML